MRQLIIVGIIIAVCAAGIGAGVTLLVTKAKINKSNDTIAGLESKVRDTEKRAQERIQSADMRAMRASNELMQVRAELERVKAATAEPAKTTSVETADVKAPTAAAADANQNIPTKVYVIKDGDSLWKIAESQLGNGTRYKEILKLNPKISSNSNLIVGSKLNLPAK